jgi:type I restriction enzyme S subunit
MKITKYKLTDICDFQGGSQPPKKEWSKVKKEGFVRMLQIRDFTQSHKDNVEYVKTSNRLKICESDDVLIGRYGASVGKILTGLEGAYNVAIMKTIPNEEIISKKYLLALLKAPLFQNFILSVGVRAAQAGFNKDDLSKFHVFLPSLENQKRIAKVLSNCENLIQKRKESIQLLDEYLKSTFLETFGTIINNPNDYSIVNIGDISTEIKDGPHVSPKYSETGIPILSTRNIRPGKLLLEQLKFISEESYSVLTKRFKPSKGDVLLTKGGTTGYAKAVDFDWPFCIWVHLACIRPIENMNSIYLEYALNSDLGYFQSQKYTHGIANKDLGLKRIAKIKILNPPYERQLVFAEVVDKTITIKTTKENSLTELENLYGSISQKAFKGELDLSKVDVSQIEEEQKPEIEPIGEERWVDKLKVQDYKLNLDEIIKNEFGSNLFSVKNIEEAISNRALYVESSQIKSFLKKAMEDETIEQVYSGDTKQVMFKIKK